MAITKNIVTDYGCPTNGTSDCRPYFLAFKADAQGQTATLTIPGPFTYDVQTAGSNEDLYLFKGIPDLTVIATGATLKSTVDGYFLGSGSMSGNLGTFARVDSVSAGSSSVHCKTASDASNFTPGEYVLLSGVDLQGLWTSSYGFPPNHHFFEWIKVLSVNATSGAVAFQTVVQGTYLDTWPHYGPTVGPDQYPDQGGPATIYKMGAGWDCVNRYIGGNFPAVTTGINCAGRDITFTNYVQNGFCINPSQNQIMRFVNSTLGFVEIDKLVGTVSYEGTTTSSQTQFQSSSVDVFQLKGTSSVVTLNGTPKKVTADPGTAIGTLGLGCIYGRTDEIYLNGCTVGVVTTPGGVPYKGPADAGVQVYPMVGGVMTIPNTANAMPWLVPGGYYFWQGQYETETPFKVLSVTQDATNIYVQTDMPGGYPSVPLTGGKLWLRPHPAPRATFINCTGCPEVVDWSQFGTIPFASRSRRTYNKNTLTTSTPAIYVPGKVVSIKFDVTAAFAGVQNPLTLHGGGQFDNTTTLGPTPTYTQNSYGPLVNMRAAGTRIITPTGVTGNQTGDNLPSLTLPNAYTWFTGVTGSFLSNDVHLDPSNFGLTIEYIMDQGIPDPTPPDVVYGGRQNSKWQQGVKNLNIRPHFASDDIKKAAAILSKMGGIARAKALTATQRSTIASTAAKARWK